MDLDGKTALVTGASRRVGKAIAKALAEAGCSVAVHYCSSVDQARQTVDEIRREGGDAWSVAADLCRPEEVQALFRQLDERYPRLDVLVNSAAGFEQGTVESTSLESWDSVMALNLRAPFLCMQHAAKRMRRNASTGTPTEAEPGLIVNICDLSGDLPWRGRAAHGVSKAGLMHLTRIAAREMAPEIRVNAIVPGAILPPPGTPTGDERWLAIGDRIPVGRPGHPGQVAQTVLFLASNDFVNGEAIFVDGGERLMGAGSKPDA